VKRPKSAVGNESKTLKLHTKITIQSVGSNVLNTELHLVGASHAVGLYKGGKHDCCAVGRKVPTGHLVRGGGVRALEHSHAPGAADAAIGALLKSVVAAIISANIVPQVEIAQQLTGVIEVYEDRLGSGGKACKAAKQEQKRRLSRQPARTPEVF